MRKPSVHAAPGDPAPPPPYDSSRLKRVAVSAFVLFHLVAISAWCLPLNSLLKDQFKQAIRPYILWTGLFAAWDMFAPDPVKLNSYVDAEVTFRDGSTKQNLIPRMDRIGFIDRYFRERYRKFATEYVRMDSYSAMWPDVARYFARVSSTPANPVTEVRLTRSWSEINPPGPAGLYQPSPWSRFTFFTYQPKPEDLR